MRIEDFRESNENVLWKGKPVKSVFIKEQIFSPLLLLAAGWLVLDIGIMMAMFSHIGGFTHNFFLVPFFIFHLFPVWLYLGRVIFAFSRWSHTEYMVTDKAVYALSGVFTTNCTRKTFQEITNATVHQGLFDKQHDVGDIFILTGYTTTAKGRTVKEGINIIDIENYMDVFKLINRTGRDIFADTNYPNDLRPSENHGYNTEYKG